MKKYYLLVIPFLLGACSKDFLEKNPLDKPSNESFWNTQTDVMAALSGCYDGWNDVSNVIYFDCASDNAYNPFPWEGWQVQATGAATPSDPGTSFFSYTTITRVNNFLENVDKATMDETLKARMKAEARFIRAWDYFRKVTLYGDVPLITKTLLISEGNLPKDPKDKVVEFILAELKEIAAVLPVSYSGADVGRATRGAALAIKARLELFTGKYAACAETSEEIMGFGYDLVPNYKSIFFMENENSKEVILDVQYEESAYRNTILGVMPPASSGGWASINPTQALVDTYECADGKTINESALYDPAEPYKNRDPRLAATIVYPGALYNGAYLNPIDKTDPTGDYYAPYGRSKTGYYPRKYVDSPNLYSNIWQNGMNAIVIRYAEVLLMYAEAKIEANQIDATVYDAIDLVRNRAGMPDVDQAVYNNQAKLRELIRRERRVELAMEGIRWFDVCRWKIGEEVMEGKVMGALLGTVSPTDGKLTLTNERIFVENRVFDADKNYLWPIPQNIIDAVPALEQNKNY